MTFYSVDVRCGPRQRCCRYKRSRFISIRLMHLPLLITTAKMEGLYQNIKVFSVMFFFFLIKTSRMLFLPNWAIAARLKNVIEKI